MLKQKSGINFLCNVNFCNKIKIIIYAKSISGSGSVLIEVAGERRRVDFTSKITKEYPDIYDYLINLRASFLINNKETLDTFLLSKNLKVSDNTLSFCGLQNLDEEFDVGVHLLRCLQELHLKLQLVCKRDI